MAIAEYVRKPILPERLSLGVQVLLLVLFCSPLFVEVTRSTVWDANEAFYAQTPREMVESGDWIHPTFNGRPRVNKPPLSYWLVAVPYTLFGPDLASERLVLALTGVLSLLAVFQIGRLFYGSGWALVATGIVATNFRFLIISRRLLIDSLLLCCSLWGIALFLYWLQRRKRSYAVLSGFCFGLGALAKGPVAFIPLFVLGLFLLATGRWRGLAVRDVLFGSAALVVTASSWFLLLGWHTGWQAVWDFIFSENLGRYLNQDFGPRRGVFYYLGVYLADSFPWSILSIPAIAAAIGAFRGRDRKLSESPTLLFLIWLAVYFLLFSFSRNKQEYYILPLYPAAAFLITGFMSKRVIGRPWAFGLAGLLALVAALFGLMGSLLFEPSLRFFLPPLVLLLAACCLAIWRNWLLAPALSLFLLFAFAIYSGPLERFKPVYPLSQIMLQQVHSAEDPSEVTLGYFGLTAPSLRFYVDRDIVELYEAEQAVELLSRPRPVYLITDRPGFELLEQQLGEALEIVATQPKLYTTARSLLRALNASEQSNSSGLTRDVLLITNRRSAG